MTRFNEDYVAHCASVRHCPFATEEDHIEFGKDFESKWCCAECPGSVHHKCGTDAVVDDGCLDIPRSDRQKYAALAMGHFVRRYEGESVFPFLVSVGHDVQKDNFVAARKSLMLVAGHDRKVSDNMPEAVTRYVNEQWVG